MAAKGGGGYDMQIKLLTIGNSGAFFAHAQRTPVAAPFASHAAPQPICLAGVGKTCLLLRYANNSFSPTFITTIGIDFKIKTIEVDGKRIKLQVRARPRRGGPLRVVRSTPAVARSPTAFPPHAHPRPPSPPPLQPIDLGHCGPGALPHNHHILLSRRAGHPARV